MGLLEVLGIPEEEECLQWGIRKAKDENGKTLALEDLSIPQFILLARIQFRVPIKRGMKVSISNSFYQEAYQIRNICSRVETPESITSRCGTPKYEYWH